VKDSRADLSRSQGPAGEPPRDGSGITNDLAEHPHALRHFTAEATRVHQRACASVSLARLGNLQASEVNV